MKQSLIIVIVVLMISALGAGVVGAQEPGGPQAGNRGPRDGGVMDVIMEATGLTTQELRDALQADGATLASVIEANGGSVDAVRAQLIANATERLDEQAETLEERIDTMLNSEFLGRGDGRGPGGRGPGGEGLDAVAELLGTDVETLRQSLQDGQTIEEIATANGVDAQTVIDALVSAAEARIDEAVANNRISAEDGEARKADLTERITDFVNNTGQNLPGRGGRGGHFDGPRGNGAPQQDS